MGKRFIVIILILIIGLAVFYFPKAPFSDKEVLFRIEKGEGSKEIAFNLQSQSLIWWGPLFRAYVLTCGISGKLQAGTYRLSPSISMPIMANRFARGDVAKEKITIIEGWNLINIGFYFENKGMFQAEELWELVGFPLDIESQEGYLFPDTYLVRKDAPLTEIVKQMQDNFEKKLAPYENEILAADKTLAEIITTASLIEKEVRTKEDKELVSGIFWKRIASSRPLESCATIAFIKRVDQWRYSFEDTRIESPYNTYLNLGLPVGPICNPGLESIEAALYPKESDYWYWLSTPEGETIFSKTLEEHNNAKAKYLK